MLFKFRKIDSPSCHSCEDEPETLDHFFFLLLKSACILGRGKPLLNLGLGLGCGGCLGSLGCAGRLNFRDILFGVLDTVSNEFLLNYIV